MDQKSTTLKSIFSKAMCNRYDLSCVGMIEEISRFSSVLTKSANWLPNFLIIYTLSMIRECHQSLDTYHRSDISWLLYLIKNIYKTCRFLHHALGCVIRINGKKQQLSWPRKCLSKRHRMEVMSEGGSSWIEDKEEHPVFFVCSSNWTRKSQDWTILPQKGMKFDMEHV